MGQLPDGFTERRSGHDRRDVVPLSPWSDPRLWISVCGLILVIFGSILGYLVAQLTTISTTQQALVISVTETRRDMKALDDRLARAENDITRIDKAFQYNLNTRLTYLEAKTGVKERREQQPQSEE